MRRRRSARRKDAMQAPQETWQKNKKSEAPKCFALADDRLRAGNSHGGSSLCGWVATRCAAWGVAVVEAEVTA